MSYSDNIYKYAFYSILFIVLSILLYTANTLSISYKEALNVFVNTSLLSIITNTSITIFGQNDIALRVPFIIFYALTVILMYDITKDFFKKQEDRLFSVIIFMVLPGLISASLLVNSAIVVTFLTLLYVYYFKRKGKHCYALLVLFLFVDNSFAIFFLALFFYSLANKENKLLIVSLILFGLSMSIYGFDTEGKPRGFLVDTFGIYASIFSPLLFIYFFYTIYRNGLKGERTLVWYISTTSLLFSLLFSMRQKIYIEDFAPFVVIFLPYMVRIFLHTVRVRLPQFRSRHYKVATITFFVLFLNVVLTIYNKPLYLVLDNPRKHFAYQYDFIKDISIYLKKYSINKVTSEDKKLLLRLKFYGIKSGGDYYITTKPLSNFSKRIRIKYNGKDIYSLYIKKLKYD
ncbi:MAG: glycosyltransferase family 39 protein [Halarcobacter sp.]